MSHRAILLLLRVVLGALFLYAGVVKALDPAQFATQIRGYRLLPEPMPAALAVYLPWLEVACGVGLVLRRGYGGALLVTMGLMVVFTVAIGSAAARGLDITCGCFGKSEEAVSYGWLISRDLLILAGLLVLAAQAWRADRQTLGSSQDRVAHGHAAQEIVSVPE